MIMAIVAATMPCPKCKGSGVVENPAAIGRVYREARLKAKCSVRELARLAGFSASYVSDLELGRRGWGPEARRRIRVVLRSKGVKV